MLENIKWVDPPPPPDAKNCGDVIHKTWAFCPVTGVLNILDDAQGVARSPYVDIARFPLSNLDDTMRVVTTSDMAYFQRRCCLDPLLKTRQQLEYEEIMKHRVRATVEDPCPECKNPIMEYFTMQLRSADEGQTVFYECPKCRFRYSTNN